MSLTPALRALQPGGVTLTPFWRVNDVSRDGNRLRADLVSDFSDARAHRHVDQVVVNDGTRPLDDLYYELRDASSNGGAVDYDALIAGRPQGLSNNPDGAFRLYRLGDAVAARNVHAAIHDALRLCKAL